jgi:hypothetical protein
MKRLLRILTVLGMLFFTLTSAAQPDCVFDMEAVKTLLDEAQQAYDSGDTDSAFELLTEAQTALKSIRAACGDVDLSQTISILGGAFTLAYPDGWVRNIDETDIASQPSVVLMATNSDALERLESSTPELSAGEQAAGVLFLLPDDLPNMFNTEFDFDFTPMGIAEAMQASITGDEGFKFGEPESLSINDRRAATLRFSGSMFEAVMVVVEFKREAVYVIIIALAAPGEGDGVETLALEMAKSVRYDPNVIPTPDFVPSPVPRP